MKLNLSQMFTDDRFRRLGGSGRKYFGEVEGRKIGVVLATKHAGSNYDSFILNKPEFDRALQRKSEGRIDELHVVRAKVNGGGLPQYVDQNEAEELAARLANVVPRSGRYGEFYTLGPENGFPTATDDDEPF